LKRGGFEGKGGFYGEGGENGYFGRERGVSVVNEKGGWKGAEDPGAKKKKKKKKGRSRIYPKKKKKSRKEGTGSYLSERRERAESWKVKGRKTYSNLAEKVSAGGGGRGSRILPQRRQCLKKEQGESKRVLLIEKKAWGRSKFTTRGGVNGG